MKVWVFVALDVELGTLAIDEDRVMKVFKVEVLVVDFDNCGADEIKLLIENARYPNHAISPNVMGIECREVDWSDEHPLNMNSTCDAEYKRLFSI